MTLFWRLLMGNTLVAVAVLTLVALSPAALAWPIPPSELGWLASALVVLVALNAWAVRVALRPLSDLRSAMESTDTPLAGVRAGVARDDEVGRLATAYNAMLDRLRVERANSAGRALAAQEAERVRISRELHDEVGQTLTAVLLTLGQSAGRAGSAAPHVQQAQDSVRLALDEVRRISARLRPGVLDDLGLIPALTSLCTETAEAAAVTVTRDLRDIGPATRDQELAIYRIAQESLTNVVRHAGATSLTLTLAREGDRAILTVDDDGRGIDAPAGAGREGMAERALLAGGTLEVTDRPGGGTRVRLDLPLAGHSTADADSARMAR